MLLLQTNPGIANSRNMSHNEPFFANKSWFWLLTHSSCATIVVHIYTTCFHVYNKFTRPGFMLIHLLCDRGIMNKNKGFIHEHTTKHFEYRACLWRHVSDVNIACLQSNSSVCHDCQSEHFRYMRKHFDIKFVRK